MPVGGPVVDVSVVSFRDRRRFHARVFEERRFILSEVMLGGQYVVEIRRLRMALARRAADGQLNLVDAGANVGLVTLFITAVLPVPVRSVGFEPFPENRTLCEHNWKKLGHVVRPEALSSTDSAEAPLYLRSTTGATIVAAEPDAANALQIGVATARLDTVWPELGLSRLDLFKLDIEGAEEAALEGATETIRQHRPFILCSYEHAGNSAEKQVELVTSADPAYEVSNDTLRRMLTFEPKG